jgi:hypothetical protein
MDSIYFKDPLGLLIELASYRFEPPFGTRTPTSCSRRTSSASERGDYNIAPVHLADAIERLVRRSRPSLSDDRTPRDPYAGHGGVATPGGDGAGAAEPVESE